MSAEAVPAEQFREVSLGKVPGLAFYADPTREPFFGSIRRCLDSHIGSVTNLGWLWQIDAELGCQQW